MTTLDKWDQSLREVYTYYDVKVQHWVLFFTTYACKSMSFSKSKKPPHDVVKPVYVIDLYAHNTEHSTVVFNVFEATHPSIFMLISVCAENDKSVVTTDVTNITKCPQ